MPNWLKVLLLVFALGLGAFALLMRPAAPAAEESREAPRPFVAGDRLVLRIGTIDSEAMREQSLLRPLLEYLNVRLAPHGIALQPRVAPDLPTMQAFLRAGEIDGVYDSPVVIALLDQVVPLHFALIRQKDGVPDYHGVVFTRADGQIRDLEDLVGKRFAVESPYSTSTLFLPLASFAARGLGSVLMPDASAELLPTVINILISEMESVSLMWVLDGRVEAGAMKDTRYDQLDAGLRDRLKVIHRTAPIPREILAITQSTPEEPTRILLELLASLHLDPSGAAVLRAFEDTRQFQSVADPAALRLQLKEISKRRLVTAPYEPVD